MDDPLNAHGAAAYAANFLQEIYRIIGNDKAIMAAIQSKTSVSILNGDPCEGLAFPYLFPARTLGYKLICEGSLSPVTYFNQQLLNF